MGVVVLSRPKRNPQRPSLVDSKRTTQDEFPNNGLVIASEVVIHENGNEKEHSHVPNAVGVAKGHEQWHDNEEQAAGLVRRDLAGGYGSPWLVDAVLGYRGRVPLVVAINDKDGEELEEAAGGQPGQDLVEGRAFGCGSCFFDEGDGDAGDDVWEAECENVAFDEAPDDVGQGEYISHETCRREEGPVRDGLA